MIGIRTMDDDGITGEDIYNLRSPHMVSMIEPHRERGHTRYSACRVVESWVMGGLACEPAIGRLETVGEIAQLPVIDLGTRISVAARVIQSLVESCDLPHPPRDLSAMLSACIAEEEDLPEVCIPASAMDKERRHAPHYFVATAVDSMHYADASDHASPLLSEVACNAASAIVRAATQCGMSPVLNALELAMREECVWW